MQKIFNCDNFSNLNLMYQRVCTMDARTNTILGREPRQFKRNFSKHKVYGIQESSETISIYLLDAVNKLIKIFTHNIRSHLFLNFKVHGIPWCHYDFVHYEPTRFRAP